MDYPPSDDESASSYDEAATVSEIQEYAQTVSQDPSMLIGHLKMETSKMPDERAASILVKAIIDVSDDAESSVAEQIAEQRWSWLIPCHYFAIPSQLNLPLSCRCAHQLQRYGQAMRRCLTTGDPPPSAATTFSSSRRPMHSLRQTSQTRRPFSLSPLSSSSSRPQARSGMPMPCSRPFTTRTSWWTRTSSSNGAQTSRVP